MTAIYLKLPEDVTTAVKTVQYDRASKNGGVKANLNDLLVEIIRTSKPVNKAARAILERAAAKNSVGSD
jgi:hypothetical protein